MEKITKAVLLFTALLLVATTSAFAAGAPAHNAAAIQTNLNYVWTILAAVLVFFMQAGFALLETGLTRSKNAVNIIMKNLMDVSAGGLVFFAVGFGLMFGASAGGWIGTDGFFLTDLHGQSTTWTWAFFLFQVVFAATAATIVSGAVAERTKFKGYLIFSLLMTAFIYPIFGSWAWGGLFNGGGWLGNLGFIDFAGSTVVHSVGGWASLAGAMVVGARVGKYDENGKPNHIAGHSLPLAALGVFILWFGWFGFNAGSTTAGTANIAGIALNTFLSAGAGATLSMFTTWIKDGKPDGPKTLNGVLAGLVAITAPCASIAPGSAILTGAVAGVLVVFAAEFIERHLVDDPVDAVAVHGVCGAWGTLAAGLFDIKEGLWGTQGFHPYIVGVQLLGIVAAFVWTFGTSYTLFTIIKKTVGLRVNGHLEGKGLDLHEHDNTAYPEFVDSDEFIPEEV